MVDVVLVDAKMVDEEIVLQQDCMEVAMLLCMVEGKLRNLLAPPAAVQTRPRCHNLPRQQQQ
jgi:hypothetical protein